MRLNTKGISSDCHHWHYINALAVVIVGGGVAYYYWYQPSSNDVADINTNNNTNSEDICSRQLSGSPSQTVQDECEAELGIIYCGDGWCVCNCPGSNNTNMNQNTNANANSNVNTNIDLTLDTDEDGLTDVEEAIYGTDKNTLILIMMAIPMEKK